MSAKKSIRTVVYGALLVMGFTTSPSYGLEPSSLPNTSPEQIKGDGYQFQHVYLVEIHVPNANVNKVIEALVAAVSLDYGKKYDQVLYIDSPGLEHFRPKGNSKGGKHTAALEDPSTRITFSIPHDNELLQKAVNAMYKAHSYEEPVVYVKELWRTQATNAGDNNPNRWWNKEETKK
ncbi:hypothetical protein [Candidatus Albibeggiatoa sp. nov. BB20]|uniref:hypothetical protein n=1 Tax=Candidatus Albibeggiatoa sp. nov. BB20 TaxID=3162723 RepID=UPI0033653D76